MTVSYLGDEEDGDENDAEEEEDNGVLKEGGGDRGRGDLEARAKKVGNTSKASAVDACCHIALSK